MVDERPKHILLIVENNPVPKDRRVWAEAQALREFGYDVSVLCPADGKRRQPLRRIKDIDIYEHPRPLEGLGIAGLLLEYANALIWEIFLSLRIFFRKRFDVIHAANPPDHLFIVALIFKPLGVKFIFDHHDVAPENSFAKFGRKGLCYRLLSAMEWLTFKIADLVISTNESYKNVAMQRGGRRSEDIFVVRNGPDLMKIPAVEPNASLRKAFKYLVGYVGIMGQQEGIENLLQAVAYIVKVKQRTDIGFIAVGKGPHWKNLVELSKRMGVEDFLNFTGYIPDRELYEMLTTVDVCVNPEFVNEFTDKSTMIKIMEYMAFGKPIAQFRTTEGEISAGDASVYVNENRVDSFAEAIIDLLEDPQKRQLMGRAGRRRVEQYLSWAKQKTVLKKAYERILNGGPSST